MSSCAGVDRAKGVHETTVDMSAANVIFDVGEEHAAPLCSGLGAPSCNCSESCSLNAVLKRGFFKSLVMSASCLSKLLPCWDSSVVRFMEVDGSVDDGAFVVSVANMFSVDFNEVDGATACWTPSSSMRLRFKRGFARGT